MPKLLTKSAYLAGLGSNAYLWRYINDRTSFEFDESAQARMDEGTEVGEYAKKLFSGIDLKDMDFSENVIKARELCHDNVLFEAGFISDGCYARMDVLIPNESGFEIIEVKSTARVKEHHLQDLKFQQFVMQKSGLRVNKMSIMHLNSQYVLQDELEVDKLFTITDVTAQVDTIEDISERVSKMKEIISLPNCPEYLISDVLSPYADELYEEFLDSLPEGNVFDLYKLNKEIAVQHWENGIKLISQIADEFLMNDKQKIQKESNENKHVDKTNIKKFIDSISYPIIHMDFEAFTTAIPVFKNTRPYLAIPFQYSLHIEYEDRTEHKEFLYTGAEDPREDFIKQLLQDIPNEGSVLAFYKSYETGRLDDIAKSFPDYAVRIDALKNRIIDLIVPFRNFYFYDKRQRGSCSIKAILPVFSNNNHSTLTIRNGEQAMREYKNNRGNISPELKKDLLEYCKMDTEGMVIILKGLRSLLVE